MYEISFQLKYTILLCTSEVLLVFCLHYYNVQCQVQDMIAPILWPRLSYSMNYVRITLYAGICIVTFTMLGINLQPVFKRHIVTMLLLLGLTACMLTLASNSYHKSQTKLRDSLKVQDAALSLNPVPVLESSLVNQSSRKVTPFNAAMLEKRKYRVLYMKLQETYECCGNTKYSDCSGVTPVIAIVKQTHLPPKIVEGPRFHQSGNDTVIQPVDYKEETCKLPCPKLTVNCKDEINNACTHCQEALNSILVTFYLVLAFTLCVCWFRFRGDDNFWDYGVPTVSGATLMPPLGHIPYPPMPPGRLGGRPFTPTTRI